MTKSAWEEIFKKFYDDNEAGGSSRWMVTPDTVKGFIRSELLRILNEVKDGVPEELEPDDYAGHYKLRNGAEVCDTGDSSNCPCISQAVGNNSARQEFLDLIEKIKTNL